MKLLAGFCLLVICAFVLQGCGTVSGAFHGAGQGLKEDVKAAKKLDGWMEEHMW